MADLTYAEENYLKAIYHLSEGGDQNVNTNSISERLQTKPASVSDMLRKLAGKGLLSYEKYMGVNLNDQGRKHALRIIRKHRLWEFFLVDKLKFNWDEVHDVAEQLEHVRSELLIKRLDEFLGYPRYDPHGDPIPDSDGEFKEKPVLKLSELEAGNSGILSSLGDSGRSFLQYLDKAGINLGVKIKVREIVAFDGSLEIILDDSKSMFISKDVAENLLVS